MQHDLLDTDITDLLGLDGASEEEQATLLAEVGAVVLEGAVIRYVAGLTEAEAAEFEAYVAEHAENEDLAALLCEQYPDFEQCLTDEIAAFKEDALAVLGPLHEDAAETKDTEKK